MPLVYRAANLVEAQLVVDELAAGGLSAEVTGRYLSGAIGELPPGDIVGVWLHEPSQTDRAREMIDAWEATRHAPHADWRCNSCDEFVGGEFGACWRCGASAPWWTGD